MKLILTLFALTWGFNVFALNLTDVANDQDLLEKASRGPKYREALKADAIERWSEDMDHRSLDDGLNHSVYEGACDPENVYQVDDVEILSYGEEISANFYAIKKGSKTVAYIVKPTVNFYSEYSVYRTHADYKRNKTTSIKRDCYLEAYPVYYYKSNSQGKVQYLGNSTDLDELKEESVSLSNAVIYKGRSLEEKSLAKEFYKDLKSKKTPEVCYVGNWEQAVESVYYDVRIGVVKVKKNGDLAVEVSGLDSTKYHKTIIKICP